MILSKGDEEESICWIKHDSIDVSFGPETELWYRRRARLCNISACGRWKTQSQSRLASNKVREGGYPSELNCVVANSGNESRGAED